MSSGTTRARVISDGHTVWNSSTGAAFTAQLPPGVTWAVATVAQLTAAGALHPPADSLAALYPTRGAGTVHADGPDTVNGVAAHRYSFPVDLHRAYCATASTERPAVQRAFHIDGPATVTGQTWVDGHGRAVKVLITATATGNGLHLRSEEDLAAFNAPVPITPPPASQTTPDHTRAHRRTRRQHQQPTTRQLLLLAAHARLGNELVAKPSSTKGARSLAHGGVVDRSAEGERAETGVAPVGTVGLRKVGPSHGLRCRGDLCRQGPAADLAASTAQQPCLARFRPLPRLGPEVVPLRSPKPKLLWERSLCSPQPAGTRVRLQTGAQAR